MFCLRVVRDVGLTWFSAFLELDGSRFFVSIEFYYYTALFLSRRGVGVFLKAVLRSITNATVRQLNLKCRFTDVNPVVPELSIVIIVRALMKSPNGIGALGRLQRLLW